VRRSDASPAIRLATADDVEDLARAQARAFFDDPLQVWALPDESTRLGLLERIFALQLAVVSIPLDASYTDATRSVGAFWAPPERWMLGSDEMSQLAPLARLAGVRFRYLSLAFEAMARHHPQEPHWYLAGLGTDPPCQGRGLGSAALGPVLALCDDDATPAYLESTKERNVPFYERHGFRVVEEFSVPEGGPRMWAMWREPQTVR
jgi:ribosomal protein S18 acetylase RimI-like enzyme